MTSSSTSSIYFCCKTFHTKSCLDIGLWQSISLCSFMTKEVCEPSIVLIYTDPLSKVVTTSYGPIQQEVNFPLKFLYLESNSNAQSSVFNYFCLINLSFHLFHWFCINIVLWSASCLILYNSLICKTCCFCASSKFMPNCTAIRKVLTWNSIGKRTCFPYTRS